MYGRIGRLSGREGFFEPAKHEAADFLPALTEAVAAAFEEFEALWLAGEAVEQAGAVRGEPDVI